MATSISAVMTVTDSTESRASKSITNISPTANPNAIIDFARGLNALTTNTLLGVELVTKTDILSEYDETDPQLSITPSSIGVYPAEGTSLQLQLKYKGAQRQVTFSGKKKQGATISSKANKIVQLTINAATPAVGGTETATTIITVAAGDGYKEASVQFNFLNLFNSQIIDV